MPAELISVPYSRALIEKYRQSTSVYAPIEGTGFGGFDPNHDGQVVEEGALLTSVEQASSHYLLVSLGAAPGEWAIKAYRAFQSKYPDGTFASVNLEGDLDHFEMTKACMVANGLDLARMTSVTKLLVIRMALPIFLSSMLKRIGGRVSLPFRARPMISIRR